MTTQSPPKPAEQAMPAPRKSWGDVVDSTEGAKAMRWLFVILCGTPYLCFVLNRTILWDIAEHVLAVCVPIFIISVFFPPIIGLCQLLLVAVTLLLQLGDALLFTLPRWLFRKRYGPTKAFWFAFLFQLATVGGGAVYLKRAIAADAALQQPARFGPSVLKRLRVNAYRSSMYREINGKILPLISPSESLRRHQEQRRHDR